MRCPKCSASIADDSNFCPRCGTPFKERVGFVGTLWRDNKPGFLILTLLLIAMIGSFVYYLNSRTGQFVVTLEKISRDEALDIYTKAALKTYCREFWVECTQLGEDRIQQNIRQVLPKLLTPVKTTDVKITYQNDTSSSVSVERFLFRNPSEGWRVEEPKLRYATKLQQLRFLIASNKGNVSFETKLQLADTLALTENHGSFTLPPGEKRIWRIGYNPGSEAQVEYSQQGRKFATPALRLG
jgi:uncharacterized protein (UPF0333 family)